MPFDATTSDYLKTKPAVQYGRDNPPPTMAEAIRMAVADVEAQERLGIEYIWTECDVCTAGAVCRRVGLPATSWFAWDRQDYGSGWKPILNALSALTMPPQEFKDDPFLAPPGLLSAFEIWPGGFSGDPSFDWTTEGYSANPTAFKRDMLALADRLEAEG
jgi:hypothetical protein